jgi:hypothetical protein
MKGRDVTKDYSMKEFFLDMSGIYAGAAKKEL